MSFDVFDYLIDVELSDFERPSIDLDDLSRILCLHDRISSRGVWFLLDPLVLVDDLLF